LARIPTGYTSRVSAPGPSHSIQVATAKGRALAGFADTLQGLAVNQLERLKTEEGQQADRTAGDERLAALTTQRATLDKVGDETDLADFDAVLMERRLALGDAALQDDDPDGLTERYLERFDEAIDVAMARFKDRRDLAGRIEAYIQSNMAPFRESLLRTEAILRTTAANARLDVTQAQYVAVATRHPGMAGPVSGRAEADIEGVSQPAGLPPERIEEAKRTARQKIGVGAMRGLIRRDPEQALARLDSGVLNGTIEAPLLAALSGEARMTKRTRAMQANHAANAERRNLRIDMAEYLAALTETGAGDEAVATRARAKLSPEDHAAFQAGEAQARERHATQAEYAFMTEEEIEADIAQQAPGGGPRDTDERAVAHAIRMAVRDEVLAARAKDPAGRAMQDEAVAAAFNAAEATPDDPAIMRQATEQRLALQREMGIEQPRLLSNAERNDIADRLMDAAPVDRLALIAGLRARYGAQAGELAAELDGEIDADTALLIDHADMKHLQRLIAQGMEKVRQNGTAAFNAASPEDIEVLPPLPILDRGEHTARKLDMGQLRTGEHYRLSNGGVARYDGEALVPMVVEIATPDPADPNAPTPPLPLPNPLRETAVDGLASERGEQGATGATSVVAEGAVDVEEERPSLPTGQEDDGIETGVVDTLTVAGESAEEVHAAAGTQPSQDDVQRKKNETIAGWMKLATVDMEIPGGWKELPKLPDGMIDRNALESRRIYYVQGKDGTLSAWHWNREKRGFKPIRGEMDVAFSIDGMHELIGVSIKRAPDGRPIYNMEQDRINAIIWGVDAVFEIADSPSAKGDKRWNDILTSSYAKAKVVEHSAIIERSAKELGVEPDYVKAIMFREQAAGPAQPMADFARVGKTISPMGIDPEKWSGLGFDRTTVRNSEDNIRAAIVLIKRIRDRVIDPTVEKIATLYNGLMMEEVSEYGAQVGRILENKPWSEWDLLEEMEKQKTSP